LEYLIDGYEAEDYIDKKYNSNKQIAFNFLKENLIAFEFEDMNPKDILENIIKIDKIQTKYHPVNFENIIKKYKTSRDITKEYEQIISQVEYVNMKKLVKISSPLFFKNRTQKNLILVFQRRDLPNLIINLGYKQNCGIPFEYLDGKVQFLNADSNTNDNLNSKKNEMIFDLKNFFDKDFSKIEFNLGGTFMTLNSNNIENSILRTINISTAFSIRNCLPFDLGLDIPIDKNFKNFWIPKSETINLDFFSEKDNILANVCLLNFKNKSNSNSSNLSKSRLIVLFNANEFYDQLEKVYAKKTNYNHFILHSEFILFDEKNNPIKLFIQIEDNFYTKTLIIYANAVIINHTMLDLKFYNLHGKKHVEIPGQTNSYSSFNKEEEKNIFLISEEKVFVVEVLNDDKKSINCFSEPIRLNAIGLSSSIECKNGKEAKYEFIHDTHLSLVAKDLQIYTNIIRILPKFIIVNELKVPISICLNNDNYSNNESPEVVKSKEKRPFHFFGMGTKSKTCFRPMEDDCEKKYQSGSKWMWSNFIDLEKSNYMTLQIPGINPQENKYINFEKKIIEGCFYIVLSETNYGNCQFFIENNCKYKSFKVFQNAYEYSAEFLNAETKRIFSWANYIDKQYFSFECYDTKNIDNIKSMISKSKFEELAYNKELNLEKLIIERNTFEIKEDGISVINRKKYSEKDNSFVIINNKNANNSKSAGTNSFSNNANNNNSGASSINNLICENDKKFNYPFESRIFVNKDLNVLISISTDGFRKIVRFSDEVLNNEQTLNIEKEIANNEAIEIRFLEKNQIQSNGKQEKNSEADAKFNKIIELTQFNFKISQLGISIISDNRFIKETRRKYNRFEILYVIFKDIEFLLSTENNFSNNPPIKSTMQLKISHAEFDNQYSNFTKYPIIFCRNMEIIPVDKDNNPIMLPFFNLIVESVKNKDDIQNQISHSESITLLRYLIQSFDFSVDSEVMEAILNFISSITIELNTSLTDINPIFESQKQNQEQGIIIKIDYYDFKKYYDNLKISNSEKKYFIENLITSSIEMKLSFNTNSKSKFFQNYITSNPFLSSILSTVSNIDKADINLNTYQMQNIYGSIYDIFNLILVQYNQEILSKIFRIFGAADFLGNPNNLIKNLGTGFKDFFQKPMEGVMKGPLDGFKGAIDGSVSLMKHAVDGTFSATSKIAGGLSKGILYISQDEKYMNDIEKKKITEKPTNFIEGFGYGISSMASGVCSGVKDVFVKPVEGAKKENIAGFGKGILKGFGGLVSKPISGFLELVSKTSEGIKNTVVTGESELKPERKPRAFYGKHKYVNFFKINFFLLIILRLKLIINSMLM
jgi:vacuolar protein sorting-associated protein 13A/C